MSYITIHSDNEDGTVNNILQQDIIFPKQSKVALVNLNVELIESVLKLDENVIDGDVVMVRHNRFFFSAYIVLMGVAYGIQDDARGMSKHQLDTMLEHTIWRI